MMVSIPLPLSPSSSRCPAVLSHIHTGWSLLYVTAILTIPSSAITYLAYPTQTYDSGVC